MQLRYLKKLINYYLCSTDQSLQTWRWLPLCLYFFIFISFTKFNSIFNNMSYSQFTFGKTDHIHSLKFHTSSGNFIKPLPSKDLQDYVINTPELEGYKQEKNKAKNKRRADRRKRYLKHLKECKCDKFL